MTIPSVNIHTRQTTSNILPTALFDLKITQHVLTSLLVAINE